MIFTVPSRTLWMRWNAIICALAIFVWSTPEEDRPVFAALLGLWLSLTVLAGWAVGKYTGAEVRGWRALAALGAFGAGTGAGANLAAVLLMVFKDVRHAHPYPDFPPEILAAMLQRLPAWTLAGALFGAGAACLTFVRTRRLPDGGSSAAAPML